MVRNLLSARRCSAFLGFVAAVSLVTACPLVVGPGAFFDPSAVITVTLPAVTGYGEGTKTFPRSLNWTLTWWDGRRVRKSVLSRRRIDTEHVVEIVPARGGAECLVFLAVPRIESIQAELCGYGGWVFPPETECVLSLPRGFIADAILEVAADGLAPELVNIERLQYAVDQELAGGAELIDTDRVANGLRSLAFRRYHVRRRERYPLVVREPSGAAGGTSGGGGPTTAASTEPAAGPSAWFTDDQRTPVCRPVVAGDYTFWTVPVATGEVRSLWRPHPRVQGVIQKMTLTRDEEGHGSYHVFSVGLTSPRY